MKEVRKLKPQTFSWQLVVLGATPAVAVIVAQASTLMVSLVFALSGSATASVDTPAVGVTGLWLWLTVSH